MIQATKQVYIGYNENKKEKGEAILAWIRMQFQSSRIKILLLVQKRNGFTKHKKDLRQKNNY